MKRVLFLAWLLGTAASAGAWDVRCERAAGVECTDPLDNVRQVWESHPRAEHRALLQRTLELSGLPGSFQLPFDLTVFSGNEPFEARVREFPIVPDVGMVGGPFFTTYQHESVAPVRRGATRRRVRAVSIPGMANLPDFAYTLWDWASGNEQCPPDPSNFDPVDCHNYETHIGWLNSNHMVPQAQRFYEHLHRVALAKAARCKEIADDVPALHLPRFAEYVRQCEKQALVLEAVGQHYLQDSWASGHMWERWGGPEIADFGGDRALGFVVAALTGLIHGGKAAFDDTFPFSLAKPWDDPMNAPFADVGYVDPTSGPVPLPGVGDIFLPLVDTTHPDPEGLRAVPSAVGYDPQRRALLGCAVDGVREVYAATARLHGEMAAATTDEIDATRSVANGSCWDQRVTNRAIAAGCGVHRGRFPDQIGVELDDSVGGFILLLTETRIAPLFADAPQVSEELVNAFRADAAYACTLAQAMALDPSTADGTDLASGGLPAIAGIGPNSQYARGGPTTPPASWADPFLPWTLNETDPDQLVAKRALNLTFSDANAADRCDDYSEADLNEFRDLVTSAMQNGDSTVIDARCGQCVQQVAPHLRFGVSGNHDGRREALCAFAGPPSAAFVYTGEDPAAFTGTEDTSLDATLAAAGAFCGCATTTTTTSTTTTTIPSSSGVTRNTSQGTATVGVLNIPLDEACILGMSRQSPPDATNATETATCTISDTFGNTASGTATMSFTESYAGGGLVAVTVAGSGTASGSGDGGASAAPGYQLDFAVARTTTASIGVQLPSGVNSTLMFLAVPGGPVIPGFTGGSTTVMLAPGRYFFAIQDIAVAGAGGVGSSSVSFSATLSFGP